MELHIVDYSQVYFVVLNNSPIPPRRGGKFVLIANHDDRYAVFSPKAMSRYHANIVERFLSLRHVPGHYSTKGDRYECNSVDWEMFGGGHWELDEDRGTLSIFGWSQAYGSVDLEELATHLSDAGGVGGCREVVVG